MGINNNNNKQLLYNIIVIIIIRKLILHAPSLALSHESEARQSPGMCVYVTGQP